MPQQHEIDPNELVSITLPIGLWNVHMTLIGMAAQALQEGLRTQLAQRLKQARPRAADDEEGEHKRSGGVNERND